jgi:trigger factor
MGVSPDDYLRQLVEANQISTLYAEVRRNKALNLVVESATITDASGRPVDLAALVPQAPAAETSSEDAAEDVAEDVADEE